MTSAAAAVALGLAGSSMGFFSDLFTEADKKLPPLMLD
jgi:hypothetical protein